MPVNTKMNEMKKLLLLLGVIFLITVGAAAQRKLVVNADKLLSPVSPTMWGVFFEDINFGADGGLYAELVKNRSFEFPTALMGWRENRSSYDKGRILVINKFTNETNTRYARVTLNKAEGSYALSNEGFRGMGFHKESQYDFSVLARVLTPGSVKLKIQLLNSAGAVLGSAAINDITAGWKKYTASITVSDTAQRGKLNIVFEGEGVIDIDVVSLFPKDTWKGRPGGLRKDIVQKIADLKPGFLRFPGGCIVEGKDLTNRYQWKTTVGNTDDRTLIMNRWNVEFRHRAAPDYYQSFGLGFYEYFLLAEDIGAAPLPILNCGMACQFNSAEVVAMDELQPYIDDALDLIEFANGAITTKWGKLRNDMGHPAPFQLQFLGVGNEQWEPQYIERYKVFEKAILAKYPDIKIVSGAGPFAEGEYFNYAWKELRHLQPALVDEHYYKPPEWFLKNAARYDNYDRSGPKVFAGEYAAHIKGNPGDAEGMNSWEAALAEAAFMTGLERNADMVQMCSYAPLLAHTDAWQWRPDLIWFDNLKTVATPNYYVQQLFSTNRGTHVVTITEDGKAITGKDGLYSSAVADAKTGDLVIKIVNTTAATQLLDINIAGLKIKKATAAIMQLSTKDLAACNKLSELEQLKPEINELLLASNKLAYTIPAYAVTVIKIPAKTK